MKKKLLSILLSVCTLAAFTPAVTNADSDITVIVDGARVQFDQPPVIIDGRTLVPVRAIFEALGADVDWDGDTRTAISRKDAVVTELQIDNPTMSVAKGGSAKGVTLDVPPQVINDRTLVPARAIAEAFGCEVNWNGSSQTVDIKSNEIIEGTSDTGTAAFRNGTAYYSMTMDPYIYSYDGSTTIQFAAGSSYVKNLCVYGNNLYYTADSSVYKMNRLTGKRDVIFSRVDKIEKCAIVSGKMYIIGNNEVDDDADNGTNIYEINLSDESNKQICFIPDPDYEGSYLDYFFINDGILLVDTNGEYESEGGLRGIYTGYKTLCLLDFNTGKITDNIFKTHTGTRHRLKESTTETDYNNFPYQFTECFEYDGALYVRYETVDGESLETITPRNKTYTHVKIDKSTYSSKEITLSEYNDARERRFPTHIHSDWIYYCTSGGLFRANIESSQFEKLANDLTYGGSSDKIIRTYRKIDNDSDRIMAIHSEDRYGGFGYTAKVYTLTCDGNRLQEINSINWKPGSTSTSTANSVEAGSVAAGGGVGAINCPICGGRGTIQCNICGGDGKVYHYNVLVSGEINCTTCHGTGHRDCYQCGGTGVVYPN